MPDETTATVAPPPDGQGKNSEGAQPTAGAATGAATTQPPAEKTFTQAEVDAMFQKRLSKAVKAELKKMSGDGEEGQPSVEEMQRERDTALSEARTLRAKDDLFDYVDDGRFKVGLRPENRKAFWRLAKDQIEFDDSGKPSNISEVVKQVKLEAPALFTSSTGSVDAGAQGNGSVPDMNFLIRRSAGRA